MWYLKSLRGQRLQLLTGAGRWHYVFMEITNTLYLRLNGHPTFKAQPLNRNQNCMIELDELFGWAEDYEFKAQQKNATKRYKHALDHLIKALDQPSLCENDQQKRNRRVTFQYKAKTEMFLGQPKSALESMKEAISVGTELLPEYNLAIYFDNLVESLGWPLITELFGHGEQIAAYDNVYRSSQAHAARHKNTPRGVCCG